MRLVLPLRRPRRFRWVMRVCVYGGMFERGVNGCGFLWVGCGVGGEICICTVPRPYHYSDIFATTILVHTLVTASP